MLKVKTFGDRQDVKAFYRPGTTDENVLREVIETKTYRRKKLDFDVKSGEKWLDLGANIGAFALYCRLYDAEAVCYEPDAACFDLLKKNAPKFECYRSAVTNIDEPSLTFWCSRLQGNNSRGTVLEGKGKEKDGIRVPNLYAGELKTETYDGIKMDIEGSEFGLLDDDLLPACNKLVFEYHFSRDKSMANLRRRISKLRSKFKVVSYPPELDRLMAAGGEEKPYYDRTIFCMGRR